MTKSYPFHPWPGNQEAETYLWPEVPENREVPKNPAGGPQDRNRHEGVGPKAYGLNSQVWPCMGVRPHLVRGHVGFSQYIEGGWVEAVNVMSTVLLFRPLLVRLVTRSYIW